MGCITSGGLTVIGNFADLQPNRPENFDYMSDAKWLEDYPLDKRERIGGTVCSCKKIRVHYSPYYGYDNYHVESCNLMRKIRDKPQLTILWAYNHLPAIIFSRQAVPAKHRIPIYIKAISRTHKLKVRNVEPNRTLPLF